MGCRRTLFREMYVDEEIYAVNKSLNAEVKQKEIRDRTLKAAEYIVDNHCTIRCAAENLMIPKSTIHYDIHKHLRWENAELYLSVLDILKNNWNHRIERMHKARRWKCAIGKASATYR